LKRIIPVVNTKGYLNLPYSPSLFFTRNPQIKLSGPLE